MDKYISGEKKIVPGGLFISFEGGEGGGKGTQIRMLKEHLESKNYDVEDGRDPGGVELSEKIRALLLDAKYSKQPITELFLHEAARAEYTHHIIKPVLEKGGIFISDRFYDSTTAYQGYGANINLQFIEQCNLIASDNLIPDITYFLNIPVHIGLERAKNCKQEFACGDSYESKPKSYHERVREGYLTLAKENERFKIIDSTKTKKEMHEEIIRYFNDVLVNKAKL